MSSATAIKPTNSPHLDVDNITDLNDFVLLLTKWHTAKVEVLEHMLKIPEGTEASLSESVSVVLTGDAYIAYQIGLSTALSELGILPFVYELESDDKATPPTAVDESVKQ